MKLEYICFKTWSLQWELNVTLSVNKASKTSVALFYQFELRFSVTTHAIVYIVLYDVTNSSTISTRS